MPEDALYLRKHFGQGVSVVTVLFECQSANEDVGVSRFGDGGLGAEFVFLVVFTFA